jgi:hypothetical protein
LGDVAELELADRGSKRCIAFDQAFMAAFSRASSHLFLSMA